MAYIMVIYFSRKRLKVDHARNILQCYTVIKGDSRKKLPLNAGDCERVAKSSTSSFFSISAKVKTENQIFIYVSDLKLPWGLILSFSSTWEAVLNFSSAQNFLQMVKKTEIRRSEFRRVGDVWWLNSLSFHKIFVFTSIAVWIGALSWSKYFLCWDLGTPEKAFPNISAK